MIRVKNYETVFKFAKVMPQNNVASFFRTRCIIVINSGSPRCGPSKSDCCCCWWCRCLGDATLWMMLRCSWSTRWTWL